MSVRFRVLAVFVVWLALFWTGWEKDAFATPQTRVAIVLSHDARAYDEAEKGFLEVIRKSKLDPMIKRYTLKGSVEHVDSIVEEISFARPTVIITVGSPATKIIASRVPDIPIVFSMVLYPVASGFVPDMNSPGENLTGAAMDVPIETQFEVLSSVVPRLRRVGVLYNPEETGPIIDEAERVARSMKLQLVAEQVRSEADVLVGMNNLDSKGADVLWGVADGTVFTVSSFRYLIQKTVERGMPFMGPNSRFVKSGALIALGCNYRDNGRQAAELALRVLHGESPSQIPIARPRETEMALNLRVAEYIGLKIPDRVVNEADEVFR